MSDIFKAPEWSLNRALLRSMGNTDEDIDRPIIGIADSWNEIVPGHKPLRAEDVKKGVLSAGGTPLEFGTIAVCDGIAQGHDGMELLSGFKRDHGSNGGDTAKAEAFDGLVLVSSCDKAIPAHLMALARLDMPSTFVPGGSMITGIDDLTLEQVGKYAAMLEKKKITKGEYDFYSYNACASCGACQFMGTASTMQCMAEALGLALPGSALIPTSFALLRKSARKAHRA
jgi:dihydroxy-acid dehydratase